MPISISENRDNMDAMREKPDGFWELAIVDPPYGLGSRLVDGGAKGGMGSLRRLADDKVETWDVAPGKQYFEELQRVSKKQIIWGGNYFLNYLGATDGFIVWDKMNGTNPLADAELAWKGFEGTTRMFRMHHFSAGYEDKIHPTQKPVPLYKWLLKNYAKPGDKILDTHTGSQSSRIAAWDMGLDYWGQELDPDYFNDGNARFEAHIKKPVLFAPEQMYNFEQTSLF